MSSNIVPAAVKPSVPPVKGSGTARDTIGTSGFSDLLDARANESGERQPVFSHSAASSRIKQPNGRHEQTASGQTSGRNAPHAPPPNESEATDRTEPEEGKNPPAQITGNGKPAAGEEEENGDAEPPKHKTTATDVSAILFGLSTSLIVDTFRSAGGDASERATGSASGEIRATGQGQNAPVEGHNKPDARQFLPSGMWASPQPTEGKTSGPTGSGRTIPGTARATPNVEAALRQSASAQLLRGVTVTAVSETPATTMSAAADKPQPAGTGPGPALSGATAPPTSPRLRSMDPGTGSQAGSNRHGGGDNSERPSNAIPHNTSPQAGAAGSAAFGGVGGITGASAPLLGQTASSFVAGMGTPQSWAAYLNQGAPMANAPATAAPVRSLSIALRPAELGAVTANLHLSGQQLRIDVEVQTQEAHQRLSNDADDIVKSLRALGFDVSHVTIRHGGNALSAAAGANQAAGQSNAQFQGSNASGGGPGGGTRSNTGKHDADNNSDAPSAQPVGNDGGPRGVYI